MAPTMTERQKAETDRESKEPEAELAPLFALLPFSEVLMMNTLSLCPVPDSLLSPTHAMSPSPKLPPPTLPSKGRILPY